MTSTPGCLSLSLLHSGIAVAADKHYLVCDHVHSVTPPATNPFKISQSGADCVDTLGRHTVSSVGVGVASVAVTSQKTQGNSVSLLTSSVCLAARLIAGCVVAKRSAGPVGARAANTPNPPFTGKKKGKQGPKQTHISVCGFSIARTHTHTEAHTFQKHSHCSKHSKPLRRDLNAFYYVYIPQYVQLFQ